MAKIRIFELARDLNMKSKVLLEKLKDMGIEAKSHMSSLEDADVSAVKGEMLGKKTDVDAVEETRVKPTLIRRRKKVVQQEPKVIQPVDEPEASAGTEAPEETPEPEVPPEEKPPKTPSERKPVLKIVKKKAVEEPVTEEPEPEPEPETEPEPEPETEPETETETETEPLPEPETEAAIVVDKTEPVDKAEAPKEETPPVENAAVKAEQPAVPEPVKPSKPKKRKRKETPAKIIKMAAPAPPPPPEAKKPKSADGSEPSPEAREGAAAAKGKKGKRKIEEPVTDRKFFKKKISFRRKAVVEGEDLYGRGGRGRKGRKGPKGKSAVSAKKTQVTTAKAIKRRVKIDDTIVLSELAKRMGIKAGEMIKTMMGLGVMTTVNQTIDFDTAVLIAGEFDYEVERAAFEEDAVLKQEVKDDPGKLAERPPVVTIMGHVDHGKTSLLDAIRKTRVTDAEAGGITQHIGAYYVNTKKGRIVFLDTPGHEAFTAMRSRGASITDIVILVVAADDGVMPQTIEAINHARAAEVPIIVAVNKIDKANAEPDRVLRQLAEQGLTPEEWGGDTIFVRVSAKQDEGIDDLLEMILLQAEVLELKANPDKLAAGHVIEAKLDSGRGPVATVLVQEGTLNLHDPVVCGIHYGKLRALVNDRGKQVDFAGPSIPVEIIGLSGVPNAGDEFIALADEKGAKQVSMHRIQKQRSKELAQNTRVSLESLFEHMKTGEAKDLNLIIKADVHGSIEALKDSLVKLSNDEVNINVVHAATGTITESDVSLASVSDAIILGFNVRPNPKVQSLAAEEHVDIRFYNVIYNVIKEIQDAILGMMESTYEEKILGLAEVRQVFHVPKIGAIAGSYVTDGKIQRGQLGRLLRDGVVLYEGKINSLRRFKDDAKEVSSGYECGIGIENYNDIKVGDTVECYYLEEIKPTIDT